MKLSRLLSLLVFMGSGLTCRVNAQVSRPGPHLNLITIFAGTSDCNGAMYVQFLSALQARKLQAVIIVDQYIIKRFIELKQKPLPQVSDTKNESCAQGGSCDNRSHKLHALTHATALNNQDWVLFKSSGAWPYYIVCPRDYYATILSSMPSLQFTQFEQLMLPQTDRELYPNIILADNPLAGPGAMKALGAWCDYIVQKPFEEKRNLMGIGATHVQMLARVKALCKDAYVHRKDIGMPKHLLEAYEDHEKFAEKLVAMFNHSTLQIQSFANLFVKDSGYWTMYFSGHGNFRYGLNGLERHFFRMMLRKLDHDLKISLISYLTCFSGGTQIPFVTDALTCPVVVIGTDEIVTQSVNLCRVNKHSLQEPLSFVSDWNGYFNAITLEIPTVTQVDTAIQALGVWNKESRDNMLSNVPWLITKNDMGKTRTIVGVPSEQIMRIDAQTQLKKHIVNAQQNLLIVVEPAHLTVPLVLNITLNENKLGVSPVIVFGDSTTDTYVINELFINIPEGGLIQKIKAAYEKKKSDDHQCACQKQNVAQAFYQTFEPVVAQGSFSVDGMKGFGFVLRDMLTQTLLVGKKIHVKSMSVFFKGERKFTATDVKINKLRTGATVSCGALDIE